MKKSAKIMILLTIIFIFIGTITFLFSPEKITGKTIKDNYYLYTKAICNETNYCQDYEFICKGTELINKTPITGAVIQHSADWKDPRDKEIIEKIC